MKFAHSLKGSDATNSAETIEEIRMQRKQLTREIACLERQISRMRQLSDFLDEATLGTYEEMISARRAMLEGLV